VFAINEIIPISRKYDQSGEFPHEVLQEAFNQGLMNTIFPQKIGGPGLGILDSCLIVEETAAADPGITTSLSECRPRSGLLDAVPIQSRIEERGKESIYLGFQRAETIVEGVPGG